MNIELELETPCGCSGELDGRGAYPDPSCEDCAGAGAVLTSDGRKVLNLVARYLTADLRNRHLPIDVV